MKLHHATRPEPKKEILTNNEIREAWGLIRLEMQWTKDSRIPLIVRVFDELKMFREMHGIPRDVNETED